MSEPDFERTETDALLDELLGDDLAPGASADDGSPNETTAIGRQVPDLTAAESPQVGEWFSLAKRIDEPAASAVPTGATAPPASAPAVSVNTVTPPVAAGDRNRNGRTLLLSLLGLLLVATIAGAAYWFGRSSAGEVASSADSGPAGTDESEQTDGAGQSDQAQTGAEADADAGAEAETAEQDVETEADPADEDASSAPVTTVAAVAAVAEEFPEDLASLTFTEVEERNLPHTVIIDGQVHVRGRLPSQVIADTVRSRVAAVVGADNVFVEVSIDPNVPLYLSSPVYVEDVVLFDFNETVIKEDFIPLLELGTMTMLGNPAVTITVVAYTDAVGSEETNLKVATERGEAVVDYWVGRGIDRSRITIDPRGELGASEDDDDQTAANNRRVEFIFTNFLG